MSNSQDLLFEIGCEELPPKSLNKMAESLLRSVTDQLLKLGISFKGAKYFSSPRRLAFIIDSLANQQPDKSSQRLGPPVASSFDDCGVPTNAAVGFAKSCGTTFENL
ncbi:glycine--tRNA ligase subunit beta, partial [Francisellaceae bacterium]|nr:glycine--tRNA ligase subunit beta [Francisellaceae bacterium]